PALEMLGIPYRGPAPPPRPAPLDKDWAKRPVASVGVPVPRGATLAADADPGQAFDRCGLSFPVIVKPAWEGSSKGIRNKCLVGSRGELAEAVASRRRDPRPAVV